MGLLLAALAGSGCGARTDVDAWYFGAGGATSSSATAGAGGETGGIGGGDIGGAGIGGDDIGGGDTGGTGIGGTGIGGTGGVVVSPECDPLSVGFAGDLDGQPIDLTSALFQGFSSSGPGTSYVVSYSDRGLLTVKAPFDNGTFPAEQILLSLPPEAPSSSLWLCDPDSEAVTVSGLPDSLSVSFTLHDLRLLGVCPGKPVAGSLDYCDPAGASCAEILSGQLGGAPFSPILDSEISGPMAPEHLAGFQDGGVLALEFPPSATAGTGVLVTPSTGPDPGAVYCIGQIAPGADAAHFKLTDLSRLGSCAEGKPAGGTLSVCLGW